MKAVKTQWNSEINIFIKNYVIKKCNSRVFIGLAIMGYEPLQHALQIR